MPWALLIVAAFAAFFTELIAYSSGLRKFPVVLVIQFLVSFGATYGITQALGEPFSTQSNVLATCAGVSLAIVLLNMVLHHYLGSWSDRRPGPGVKT